MKKRKRGTEPEMFSVMARYQSGDVRSVNFVPKWLCLPGVFSTGGGATGEPRKIRRELLGEVDLWSSDLLAALLGMVVSGWNWYWVMVQGSGLGGVCLGKGMSP